MPKPIADKRREFRALHERGCFVIPNPWNAGSAKYLAGMGFKALATTSAGFAHSQGFSDGAMTLTAMLDHARELAEATSLPVNVDFENGFAHEPDKVAENVRLCVDTGIAGLSIEDYRNDGTENLYDFDLAVARVKAARAAIDKSGSDVLLTGRAECFLHGKPDLDEAIKRLKAFSDAGADCLYVPGIKTREQIEAVVKAVSPKPVNFLNAMPLGFTVKDLDAMGVRRISIGGTLSRVAMTAFIKAAREIAEKGSFEGFAGTLPNAELNKFFDEFKP